VPSQRHTFVFLRPGDLFFYICYFFQNAHGSTVGKLGQVTTNGGQDNQMAGVILNRRLASAKVGRFVPFSTRNLHLSRSRCRQSGLEPRKLLCKAMNGKNGDLLSCGTCKFLYNWTTKSVVLRKGLNDAYKFWKNLVFHVKHQYLKDHLPFEDTNMAYVLFEESANGNFASEIVDAMGELRFGSRFIAVRDEKPIDGT